MSIELSIGVSADWISEFNQLVNATEDFYSGTDMTGDGGEDLDDTFASRKRHVDVLDSQISVATSCEAESTARLRRRSRLPTRCTVQLAQHPSSNTAGNRKASKATVMASAKKALKSLHDMEELLTSPTELRDYSAQADLD